MSLQASRYHLSYPKVNGLGNYEEVEVSFTNIHEPKLDDYWVRAGDYYVYGRVPVNIIEEIIKEHGGINMKETLQNAIYSFFTTRFRN